MNGWLVVNEFAVWSKFQDLFRMFMESAERLGIGLIKKSGAEIWFELGRNSYKSHIDADFVLFWDKDVKLAHALETLGVPVFNSSSSIALCDDKSLTHLELSRHDDLRLPRTFISPKKNFSDGETDPEIMNIAEELGFPCIIKECFGSFGYNVFLAKDTSELVDIIRDIDVRPYLIQEFISSSTGRDIRLQVVGGRVIASMYRYNDTDFRANLTNGGSMKKYIPTKAQEYAAIMACRYLGVDFAGVDILFGENDDPVICEVNSNAHFKNLFNCTGVNTADVILEYIMDRISITG